MHDQHGIFKTKQCNWFRVMWRGKEVACKEKFLDACAVFEARELGEFGLTTEEQS